MCLGLSGPLRYLYSAWIFDRRRAASWFPGLPQRDKVVMYSISTLTTQIVETWDWADNLPSRLSEFGLGILVQSLRMLLPSNFVSAHKETDGVLHIQRNQ